VKYVFLLIGGKTELQWSLVLQRALSPVGEVRIVSESEKEAMQAALEGYYDVFILDATTVRDTALMVSHLRAHRPQVRIIVAAASPTWQQAREVLQAGAADYIRKSQDEKELRSNVQTVLEAPPPSWRR
jgi:DNA-binding NarL/FixJ family response regulator